MERIEGLIPESPLADRMRPRTMDEFAGQQHLLAPGAPLRVLLEGSRVPSCILYGPPGVGKTTLVRLMASVTERSLLEINAVTAKVAELRDLVEEAKRLKSMAGGLTAIAFVDELYHFNRSQQNVLLPSVERGDIILVGTTTENPWIEINKTLLSRMVIFELHPLGESDIVKLLRRAMTDPRGLGRLSLETDEDVLSFIAGASGGDARQALTRLEVIASSVALTGASRFTREAAMRLLPTASTRYDKNADDHYTIISALIKSMRGSDPDAAVYWLARMVEGGEDVRFIARRLVIFAAEDVGLADPEALRVAAAAAYAADFTGYPEARIILSEAVLYLATAPKSNSAYLAISAAQEAIRTGDVQRVPDHLNPHGSGYRYPHDDPRHWVPQQYMTKPGRFYFPCRNEREARILARMQRFWKRFRDDGQASGQGDQ